MSELPDLTGIFVIRRGDVLSEYTRISDMPAEFDNLIKFAPDFPSGVPHTQEEHDLIASYNVVLQELLKREKR